MMQEEIEALKKNLVLKCHENCNGEWLNLESRNLVPGDLMKLECGGVVCADGEVLEGKWIRVNTSQVNREVRIIFRAGGETNQVRRAPPSSLAAKPARFEEGVHSSFSQSSVLSSVGHGSVDPKARGVENFENRSGEEFRVNSLLSSL